MKEMPASVLLHLEIQQRKDTITERKKWVRKEGREVKSKCDVERHVW